MTIPEALECWNTSAEKCGWPQVRRLSADRERKLRDLLKKGGLEEWREALAKAEASDFLCGRTSRSEKHQGWRFSFDAMVRESFFLKILEGNYTNAAPGGPIYKSPMDALWEARLSAWKPGKLWLGIWGPDPTDERCEAPQAVISSWRARQNMN